MGIFRRNRGKKTAPNPFIVNDEHAPVVGGVEQVPVVEAAHRVIGDVAVEAVAPEADSELTLEPGQPHETEAEVVREFDPTHPDLVVQVLTRSGDRYQTTSDCPEIVPIGGERQDPTTYYRNKYNSDGTYGLKPNTYCSNNGVVCYVDSEGNVFVTYATDELFTKIRTLSYENDSFYVPLSNGEYPGSKDAVRKMRYSSFARYAKELGLTLDRIDESAIDGASEYEPEIHDPDDSIHSLQEDIRRLNEELVAIDSGEIPNTQVDNLPELGAINDLEPDSDDDIRARNREHIVHRISELSGYLKIRTEQADLGIDGEELHAQRVHNHGRYSVAEQDGSQVLRFVDAYGRFMEAPYSEEAEEQLKVKGYTIKTKIVENGVERSPAEVNPPAVHSKTPASV